jgi:hypothetical protein
MYFLLAEPPKSGYSYNQLEEMLLCEDSKLRHAFKKELMFYAFIKDIHPLSRNKEKLERIKKEYRLRYLN